MCFTQFFTCSNPHVDRCSNPLPWDPLSSPPTHRSGLRGRSRQRPRRRRVHLGREPSVTSELASRRGWDKRGFHRRVANPQSFCRSCFMCAHVAIVCHISQNVPMNVDYGELRHFCDDPVCPDHVWKLSIRVRNLNISESEFRFLGNALWTQESHPVTSRICLSQTL